jgi:hypothetical protein
MDECKLDGGQLPVSTNANQRRPTPPPKVSAREYLEAALTPVAGGGAPAEAKNTIRSSIKGLFPDRCARAGRSITTCLQAPLGGPGRRPWLTDRVTHSSSFVSSQPTRSATRHPSFLIRLIMDPTIKLQGLRDAGAADARGARVGVPRHDAARRDAARVPAGSGGAAGGGRARVGGLGWRCIL